MWLMKTRDGVGGPVDAKLEALAVVAQVGGASERWAWRFIAKRCSRFGLKFAEDLRNLRLRRA